MAVFLVILLLGLDEYIEAKSGTGLCRVNEAWKSAPGFLAIILYATNESTVES